MKRSQSRAPSPTPTAFSGISNYRTESYRPIRDKNVPTVPTIDYRLISKTHFDELSSYLAAYLAKAPPNSRSTARNKLTRLTIQQFHELSTDVYDELVRRKSDKEAVPFLPVREEFHPKRNQARQKLATLPASRFEDLSSDVYYELSRRYPEFLEEANGGLPGSSYDDYPAPDYGSNSVARANNSSRTSGRTSVDKPSDSGYGPSISSRRPSEDRRRPSEAEYMSGRRSETGRVSDDGYAGSPSLSASLSLRRKQPSQDTPRRSEDRERTEYPRRPSNAQSASGASDGTITANQSAVVGSAMIIPNKSTMEEEYIQVPFGARESTQTMVDTDRRDRSQDTDPEPDSASDYPTSPMSRRSPPAGLSGLNARLGGVDDDEPTATKPTDDYYGKSSAGTEQQRSAGVTGLVGGLASRLAAAAGRAAGTAGPSLPEDQEKMRKEYEVKIASMQTQISTMQRSLNDAEQSEKKLRDSEARVRQLEDDLAGVRRRAEEQSTTMRAMQKELDELKEERKVEKERETRRQRDDEEELQILRERCERLEEERESRQNSSDREQVEQLTADMQSLMTELADLIRRNDELMTAKDSDRNIIRDLDSQLKDYKRKYEQAKTELRSMKATSQLYLQTPKLDKLEELPMSNDGGVLDIHVTAFVSAIDSLLTAGRSSAPTRVLTPMKAVVNAVTIIIDDVRTFERRPSRERSDVDTEALRALRDRAEATLSNLTAAAKTHASSSGLSPVSLLDAAASHVSASVTDICKTVCLRKSTRAEQDQFTSQSPGLPATSGFSPSLRSVDERSGHLRKASAASSVYSNQGNASRFQESVPRGYGNNDYKRRPPSDNSSEDTNSPPPIFDQPISSGGVASDESVTEDNWAELKPYLEAQTEEIVFAIQSVLSGVRSPTPPPTLGENLTQIITIVSSIVAVCKDNLPPASIQQGNEILRELSDHANKLSEVSALPEVTKESRQTMAKSSFAIANGMKALGKL